MGNRVDDTQARTIVLDGGKYEFDLQNYRLIGARRHHVEWPAGLDMRHHNAFLAALNRIAELEDELRTKDGNP